MPSRSGKRTNWSDEETKTFLRLCEEKQVVERMADDDLHHIFGELVGDMSERGFKRSAKQLLGKFRNIKNVYDKCIKTMNANGIMVVYCPFYEEMRMMCDPRPVVTAADLQSAMDTTDTMANVDQLELAKSEFFQDNFIMSQELCYKILSSEPNNLDVLNLLAATYYRCGNYDEALEHFKRALDLNLQCGEILNNIGSTHWTLCQYVEASKYFFFALKWKPNYLNAWINYASALFKGNDLEEADNVCEIILTQHPKLVKVRIMRGDVLMELNRTQEAKEQYKIAKNDDPEIADSWLNLGFIYITINKCEKATLYLKKASELNPNLISAWLNLGVAYFKLNNYTSSTESFKKVLQLCPDNVVAMENLATMYEHHLVDIQLAVMYYKELLKFEPTTFELNMKLGFLYFSKLEKYEESLLYFKKCIEINPDIEEPYKYAIHVYEVQGVKECAEYYSKLGDLYIRQNKIKNAIIAYTHSAFLDPENAYEHRKLGHALFKMGHLDLAFIRYTKARWLEPEFPEVYYDLALYYESKNLPERAIKYYNATLQLQPDHQLAILNYANLQVKLNFE